MMNFIREGGTFSLLLLLLSPLLLGQAMSFAYRPTPKKRIVAKALLRWTLLASLSGYVAGMIGTLQAVAYCFDNSEQNKWWHILIIGSRESLNNVMLGLGLMTVAYLWLTVGEARSKAL